MTMKELYEIAFHAIKPLKLKQYGEAGQVACALESGSGRIFTGVCADLPCSLGFCAEQAAAAQMLTAGETRIRKIIAVSEEGNILPPCGRCRELISQLDEENIHTAVGIGEGREAFLEELLPDMWDRREI